MTSRLAAPPLAQAVSGRLSVFADNKYKIYLDGNLIGKNPDSWGSGRPDSYDVSLAAGRHVLAIEGGDWGDPAAAAALLQLDDASLATSPAWKVATEEAKGWKQIEFDDHDWLYATDHGYYVWGIPDFGADSPAANWIWEATSGADAVYLRAAFELKTDGSIVGPKPNQVPIVSVNSWKYDAGEIVDLGRQFDTLFSVSDPDGDRIISYEFFLTEPGVNGFFRDKLSGVIYDASQFSIAAEDLNNLQWVAGPQGSEDGIRLKATDQYGGTNEWQAENAIWSSRLRLGINEPRVREGDLVELVLDRPVDTANEPLTVYLQVNSGFENVAVVDPEIQALLSSGARIPLSFAVGESQINLRCFESLINDVVEAGSGRSRYHTILDLDVYAEPSGGTPVIGTVAKASDATPVISFGKAPQQRTVAEGSPAFFFLERKGNLQVQTDVFYTLEGEAQPDLDYARPSGKLVFEKGISQLVFSISTLRDSRSEGDETIVVLLDPHAGSSYAVDPQLASDSIVITPPLPEVKISEPRLLPYVYARTPRQFTDYFSIADDPQRKTIKGYEVKDLNPDPNSGFFLLGSEPFAGDRQLSSGEMKDLVWIFGNRGTKDDISLVAIDGVGRRSAEKTTSFAVDIAPTSYSIGNNGGFSDVTEGDRFELSIQKLDNFNQETTLQWAVFDSPDPYITATRADFKGIGKDWNTLQFSPSKNPETIELSLLTKDADRSEGSETARIWFYNSELDNGRRDWLQNEGYSYFDLGIHDALYYAMGPSTLNVEGERAVMSLARFGGSDQEPETTVKLGAQPLSGLFPAIKSSTAGLAAAGSPSKADFASFKDLGVTFDQDGVLQKFSVQLNRDSQAESGEAFIWSIRDFESGTLLDTRLGTILEDPAARAGRQLLGVSSFDFFGALNSLGQWFGENVLGWKPSDPGKVEKDVVKKFVSALADPAQDAIAVPDSGSQAKGSPSLLQRSLSPDGKPGLVGLTPGYLVAQGGANLVAQGGANLIAQGGGNVVQKGGRLVAQGGANLIAQGGGNLIAQGGGNLIAQGGGNLVSQGGANLVAQGGANLGPMRSLQSLGGGVEQAVFVAEPGGMYVATNDGQSVSTAALQALELLQSSAGQPLIADAAPGI